MHEMNNFVYSFVFLYTEVWYISLYALITAKVLDQCGKNRPPVLVLWWSAK